jgi:hypothetical protein
MNKEFGSVFFWDKILPLVDKKRAQNPTKDFVKKKEQSRHISRTKTGG